MRVGTKTIAALTYLTISLLVLGPALGRGYSFLLDMPWPVQFQISDYASHGLEPHFALHALLSILNIIIPSWILQKLVLVCVLLGAGMSTYSLAHYVHVKYFRPEKVPHYAAYLSGLIALINPFVFERLAAGQWIVLAGYAYTPFVLLMYLRYKNTKHFWITYAIFPLLSIHFWVMFSCIGAICLALFNRHALYSLLKSIRLYLWFVTVNAYWIISLFSGNNQQAESLSRSHFAAFQTVSDPNVGVLGNVVSLHGMWAAHSSLLKDTNRFWFAYSLCLLAASAWGMYQYRTKKNLKKVFYMSALAGVLSIIVAIGYAHPVSRTLLAPFSFLPFAATLRESAKALGILALIYALWTPLGIIALATKEWYTTALKCAVMLHVIMMSGMFWGLSGSLKNYDYPSDWYIVATEVPHDSKALILPWQGYLELEFADNAYVANPARAFFPFAVEQSTSTGNQLIDKQSSEIRKLVNSYLDRKISYNQFTESLKNDHAITHIIILKTGNWQRYQPLIDQSQNTHSYNSEEIYSSPISNY